MDNSPQRTAGDFHCQKGGVMISEKEIMQIVKKFAQSPDGKRAIKEKYGLDYDESFDSGTLKQYGEKMRATLAENDTMKYINVGAGDIVVGEPIKTDRGWQINISFIEDNLKRESLYDDYLYGYWGDDESRKTSDGDYRRLQDIVLLFTRGYTAKNYVYNRDYGVEGGHSKLSRPPNTFLQDCVNAFNNNTPEFVTAILSEDYINREV